MGSTCWALSMADLSTELSTAPRHHLDRVVVDKTGLADRFDFHLQWPAEGDSLGAGNVSDDLVFWQSVLRNLGLSLQSASGTVEVLAVDHVERSRPN